MASKRAGFTLVELVVVIAIVGILAATILPRFINTQSNANMAAIKSMGAAIMSAANVVHGIAAAQNLQNIQSTSINVNGSTSIQIRYGYPSASRNNSLSKLMSGNFANDWTWSTSYGDRTFWLTTAKLGGRSGVYVNNTAVSRSGCYLRYHQAQNQGDFPTIDYVTTDC